MTYNIKRALGIGIAVSVMSLGVGGCADRAEEMGHLSECADITFPAGGVVVRYESDRGFRESTSVAVVDIPVGSVDEFKRLSGFAEFGPGVPAGWKSYWDATGMTDLLSTDAGNEHSVEGYRDPRRYVVIHDSGGETRRVFVHTNC